MQRQAWTRFLLAPALMLACSGDQVGRRKLAVDECTAPPENRVSITNFMFTPSILTISQGQTVCWQNDSGGTLHTTTSDMAFWDSGALAAGAVFEFTFADTGTFPYHCNIHPFMLASVIVNSPPPQCSPGSRVVSITDAGYVPAMLDDVTIGQTVCWRNDGALTHTATAPDVWDSGQLAPGDVFEFTFVASGSFDYSCTEVGHAEQGNVTVLEP